VRPSRALITSVLIAGCASGEIYWTRSGATEDAFLADHAPCFRTAYVGYGVGNEQAYKACMRSKGWTRIQGTGSQAPAGPYFRGPEEDDDFAPAPDERCDQWRERWRAGFDRHRQPPRDCTQ